MAFDSTAELLFKISADPSEATSNIQKFRTLMGKSLGDLKGEFSSWAKEVFGALDTTKGALIAGGAAGAAGLVAITAVAAEVTKKLWECGEAAAHMGEQLDDAMTKTGMKAEELSGLRYAAQNAGLQFPVLTDGLVKFEAAIVKAQDPTSKEAALFAKLGVGHQQVVAGQKELLPLLYATADGFRAHADGAGKATAARELFGRGGAAEIEFLNRGSQGLKMWAEEARRLGLVMSEEDVRAAKMFAFETKALNAEMEGLKISIGKGVLPAMTAFLVGVEGLVEAVPKIAKIAKDQGWKWLIPGVAEFNTAKEGMAAWGAEIDKAWERMYQRMATAEEKATKPLKVPLSGTEDYKKASDLLDQLKQKSADALGPEEALAQEMTHLQKEVIEAGREFQKLRNEGKLTPEAIKRETAALMDMIPALAKATIAGTQKITDEQRAKVLAAAEDLRQKLIDSGEQTFAQQTSLLDEQMTDLAQKLFKAGTLTAENEILLEQVWTAGTNRLQRNHNDKFVEVLRSMQSEMAQYVTATMTNFERLEWAYEQDMMKYSAAEEEKLVKLAQSEAEAEIIRQQFDLNRRQSLTNLATQSQILLNSQGWQGVWGNAYGDLIRGHQALSREWAQSASQDAMLVQVALEGLNGMAQESFGQLSKGMGQGIAQSLMYGKSVGEAMRAAVAATLESISGQCLAYAIYSLALGFLRLAEFHPAAAAQAFQAAAIFGTAGIAAAALGRAVAPSQAGSGAGAAAGGASGSAAGGSAGTGAAAGGGETGGTTVHLHVYGNVIGRYGAEELVGMLNEAVEERDVRLVATQVKQMGVTTQ